MRKNPRIGESFESFLLDEGIRDEVVATAIKRTLALQDWTDQSSTGQSAIPARRHPGRRSRSGTHCGEERDYPPFLYAERLPAWQLCSCEGLLGSLHGVENGQELSGGCDDGEFFGA
jgi:hypothetical protein